MTNSNSGAYKENGRYAKLPDCPVCEKKVHFHEDDANMEEWAFAGGALYGGDMVHLTCTSADFTTENGEYWNGTEMVEA